MKWSTVPFSSLFIEPSRNGIYKEKEYHGSGTKIVNMGELFAYDVVSNQDMDRVQLSASESERFLLCDGDLLFGRRSLVEAGAGKCSIVEGLVEPTTFESSLIRVRINKKLVNPHFVFYWLKSSDGKAAIKAIVTGTNVKGIRSSLLKDVCVPLLGKEIQDRLSSIFRSYDDLIETNRRRITLLEESARLLYKEWFVDLRFPGHERAKIVDGLPEGWSSKRINDVCETLGGGTPSTSIPEYWNGEITWVVPTDITRNSCLYLLDSERKITDKGLKESSAHMIPTNAILMTSRASVGYFGLMDREVCTNQGFINIIPNNENDRFYLLYYLMSRVDEIRGNAKGSTYPEINKSTFRAMPIVIPSIGYRRQFNDIAKVVFDQIKNLWTTIDRLARARDLLLPKLMSGEIEV